MEKEKSPLIAAFLSLMVGGLGQAYLGLWKRSLSFLILEAATFLFYLYVQTEVGGLLNFAVSVVSAIDAYRRAGEKNKRIRRENKKIIKEETRELYV